jgi:flagellar hook-length control protein FliK
MENAVNIMAMVQGSSIVKKKFDVPSKTLGNDITSFRKQLNQARKDITKDNNINTKDVNSSNQRTTEKNIDKLAKAMTNNNAKAEVKTEDKEKTSVEALEQTAATETESNLPVIDGKQIDQTENEVKIEESVQAVLDMLQQLIEMMQVQKNEGASSQQITELNAKLTEVFQMLEQTLQMPIASQPPEIGKLLSNLKNDLSEFVAQFEIIPNYELDSKQTADLMNQLSEKLNQVNTLKNQIIQEAEKPMSNPEVLQQPLAQTVKVESKEFNNHSEVKVVAAIDENQQVQKTDNEKSSDHKDNEDADESTNETNENIDVKQASPGEKLNQTEENKNVAPQVEKDNFQLNIKQANANLQKDSQVKFNKSDIINQVIKKADIFVQGSHQEMVMKLEPESLGKLNLKIVIENGLVTAKFVAESQQVKEVLESSFNQLKDALQQKGITVQGFSVSVKQEGPGAGSGQGFEQWKRTIKLNSRASGEYIGLDEESNMRSNPYSYHEGKVDYRA